MNEWINKRMQWRDGRRLKNKYREIKVFQAHISFTSSSQPSSALRTTRDEERSTALSHVHRPLSSAFSTLPILAAMPAQWLRQETCVLDGGKQRSWKRVKEGRRTNPMPSMLR